MTASFREISYGDTGYFSALVEAYTAGNEKLRPYYAYDVSEQGLRQAIEDRRKYPVNRTLLVDELNKIYSSLLTDDAVRKNIDLLAKENTFTICTAHQPAIFSGTLFFVYKILHVIKIAEAYKVIRPEENFVPVYYMGSEDADLDELGHVYLYGEKISWETSQTGAIGRMKTKGLEKIIDRLEGELSVLPHGAALISLIRECYLESPDLQTATLKLVNQLFGKYGLIVLIPDNPAFKKLMFDVYEDEILNQTSCKIVEKTLEGVGDDFKIQAQPRPINLFFLDDHLRNRIERIGDKYAVVDSDIVFTREELLAVLRDHPEKFSPNVILRGLLQEAILPDIAFVDGGGELAYWLELKDLFDHYKTFYPVLILRNSFLVIDEKRKSHITKLKLGIQDLFNPEQSLFNRLVKTASVNRLSLTAEINLLRQQYTDISHIASAVDTTLVAHVAALEAKAVSRLDELEKKLLKAEKRKFDILRSQLSGIKSSLFPNGGLQERVENFMPFYARWGESFIDLIYDASLVLEQRFVVIEVNGDRAV
jgi:bacillithiol synthase